MNKLHSLRRAAPHLGAMALLALFLWQTGEVGEWCSATADEPIYIRSGLLILETREVTLNEISSPFLFKALNAIPLLGLEGAVPVALHQETSEVRAGWSPLLEEWRDATDMVHALGPRLVLPLARLVPRLTGLLLGLLIYMAAYSVLGAAAGLCSLAVYVLLPEAVAHSSLATLEVGLGAATFFTLVTLHRFLRTAALPWALLTGLGLAAAMLTKTTGLLLCGFVILVLLLRWIWVSNERKRIALGGALAMALAWIVLNGAFAFEGTFERLSGRPDYPAVQQRMESLPGFLGEASIWVSGKVPALLPRSYVNTLMTQASIAEKGKRIFFDGEYSDTGWWWLMALTFLIKMPVAFLALILFTLAFGLFQRWEIPWIHAGFALVLLICFTLLGRVNYGVRYLFPALPGLAVIAGIGLSVLFRSHWFFKGIGLGLLGWLVLAQTLVHPHPLSYANEAAGGPEELYRVLADSNVDWGQDLPALAAVMEEEGIPRVRLSYFGSDDPAAYGIPFDPLPSIGLKPAPGAPWWFETGAREHFDLEPSVYAISANNLNGLFFRNRFLYSTFQSREPDFRAGYSILLYDLRPQK